MLNGVSFTPRRIIASDTGEVRHILKNTDAEFSADAPFGEAYLSTVLPTIKKGWKLHTKSVSRLAVIRGSVRFVLSDRREDSDTFGHTQVFDLTTETYGLLTIPPMIAYAWQNIGDDEALIINISSLAHDPSEAVAIPLEELAADWKV